MVRLVGGVVECGEDVFTLEKWVVGENFFKGSASAEEFEDIRNANTVSANARTPAALAGFDRDSIESFQIHRNSYYFDDTQTSFQRQRF
jgi:hypothetical protein